MPVREENEDKGKLFRVDANTFPTPKKKQLVGSLELLIESGCIIWTSNKDSELERQKTLELQYVYSQMKRKMTARDESDAAFQSPPIFGDFPLSPLFCPFFQ